MGHDAEVGEPIPLRCDRCGQTVILRYYVAPASTPGNIVLTHRFDPHICPTPTSQPPLRQPVSNPRAA